MGKITTVTVSWEVKRSIPGEYGNVCSRAEVTATRPEGKDPFEFMQTLSQSLRNFTNNEVRESLLQIRPHCLPRDLHTEEELCAQRELIEAIAGEEDGEGHPF